jgi:hypothetical protein
MTSPNPCTALQSNWIEQIAIKGQSLSQSGIGAFFGQQGMSSGMPMAASLTIATFPFGKAIAGRPIGTTARPMIASTLRNRPMVDRVIIA